MALDPMGNGRIVIDGVPGIKDVGVVSEDDLHLTLQDEDELLAIMDRCLGSLDRSGFQGHDKGSI